MLAQNKEPKGINLYKLVLVVIKMEDNRNILLEMNLLKKLGKRNIIW